MTCYCKFMGDMHAVFAQRGKKMIVWEEACNPGGPFPLPKDTLIMVWCQGRNPADIVKSGYSVVNATWTPLYIVRDNRKTFEFLFNWDLPKFGREGSNDFFTLKDTEKLAGRAALLVGKLRGNRDPEHAAPPGRGGREGMEPAGRRHLRRVQGPLGQERCPPGEAGPPDHDSGAGHVRPR